MADRSEVCSLDALLRVLPCNVTELIRVLVDRPNVIVALTDLEGRLLYQNAAYYEGLGFEPGEPLDAYGIDRCHADDLGRVRQGVRQTAEGYASFEYRMRHRDGRWVWHSANGLLLRDGRGQPGSLLFIVGDISARKSSEEALRQSEERLRLLVESADDVILMVDLTGHVVWSSVPSRYGLRSEFLQGRRATEIFPPEQAAQIQADEAMVRESGESRTCKHHLTVGGQEVWFHDLIYPVRDAEGRMTQIGWICRNLTALKAAQSALDKERETSRRYLDIARVIIVAIDASEQVTLINRMGAEVLGRSQSDVIGHNWFDEFVPARLREEVRSAFQGLMAGRMEVFGQYENPVLTASGDELVIEWRNIVLRDDAGRIIGTLSSGGDVTERRRDREALRESEARYRGIVEDQTELICRFLRDGTLTFVNEAYCRYFGMKRDELIGRSFMPLIAEDDRRRTESVIAALSPENPVRSVEERVTNAQGEMRWQQWTNRVISDDEGRIIEYQAVGRDITEVKRANELLIEKSRMETASTMAGGIAHDFNNLMVAVLGNAELLRSEVPGKTDALEMLDSVSRSARRAADLAQKLLAFARGGKYRPTTVDLNEVVRETLQMQGRAIPSGVRVDVELADDLAKTSADRTQMNQVVMNLLLNAIEAVGLRGRVVISTWNASASRECCTRGGELKNRPHVCLSVRDNGPGMDAETVARVFQPFFTRKGPGRGLGLSAVFGIVKNHGGDVGVESVPGRGTTFRVCLPATDAPARRPERKTSASTRGAGTILVVDDEESVISVTRRMLQRLGYRVLTASSGPEAIRLAKEHRGDIHLALLDIGMPGMDGAEAFPLLAAARPSMRIIVSSGYDLDQMSRGLIQAGARGFIQKPFVSAELAREIRAVLDSD